MNLNALARLNSPATPALVLGLLLLGLPNPLAALDTSARVALMTEAVADRAAGRYEAALSKVGTLLEASPSDPALQRMRADILTEQAAASRPVPTHAARIENSAGDAPLPAQQANLEALVAAESRRLQNTLADPASTLDEADSLADRESFSEALILLDRLLASNQLSGTDRQRATREKGRILLKQIEAAIEAGDTGTARRAMANYERLGLDLAGSRAARKALAEHEADPDRFPVEEIAPALTTEQEELRDLLTRGKALKRAGDLLAARTVFLEVEARDPANLEVKQHLADIARAYGEAGIFDRTKTKEEMLAEVSLGWQRPKVFDEQRARREAGEDRGLREKMEQIIIPRVSFSGVPLSRVVDTLSALSEEYDPEGIGLNLVLISAGSDPSVTITLRRLSLDRILDFTLESVGFEYDVQSDAVVVRMGEGTGTRLETEFFPVNRSTIIRLTGVGAGNRQNAATSTDPFAPQAFATAAPAAETEEQALKDFLQRAGVPFVSVEGANLALADGQLIVTQTPRNMEKVRNILRRYSEIKQVEIEARFIEVQQGNLEELGLNWFVGGEGSPMFDPATGTPVLNADGSQRMTYDQTYASANRSLAGAFGVNPETSQISITNEDGSGGLFVPFSAPQVTNTLQVGADAAGFVGGVAQLAQGPLAAINGVIGSFDVDVIVRALSRQSGNDLMSAPKLTVLSGKTAEIVVAQELRYPENYGDVKSEVGKGDSGSGSAGVTITAGTPMDFTMRNVGVEMEVTPNVEDDDSISLLLEPKVTEFEGFVEYGGPSIAIASGRTVSVPSGFFQPIFSVRRVRTEVTIWDGATVVMGGLTREQAVTIEDKVPLLGDIPLLGRLFRSEGESTQKRNLLIFVTANLISPGGSPARQSFGSINANSLFQNPAVVTPGGSAPRSRE